MNRLPIIATTLFLAACTQSAMMSPERLKVADSALLCSDYHTARASAVRGELARRNIIDADEWLLIDQRKIQVGMSELAFICAWGTPSGWGAINHTTGRWGTNKQYVFRACRACRANYVYVRNGKVSSWQN